LSDPDSVLEELHRVLTPDGVLSFSDHHLKEDDIVSMVTDNGLFRRVGKGRKTHSFAIV
jgi:ubiquinone/menaquinone biosynthesis C-methylase UbiE